MDINKMEEDQFVTDAKFRDWGIGVVRKVLKERAYIYFKTIGRTVVYGDDVLGSLNLRTGRK